MARVTGPLMSVDASGSYGGALVFGKWKGRNTVRQLVQPTNPKSAKQMGVRAMMSFLAQSWAAIAALSKATWDEIADAKAISSFNAFTAANLLRWQSIHAPSQETPAAEASTPLTITTMTLTGGVGEASIAITPSGGTDIWGYMIFRSAAEITVPSWTNCIAVIAADGANAVTHIDTPLDAGTYHYRCCAFNTDGIIGTVKADATAVVT